MSDYRSMFDHKWLRAWDLAGKDVILEIRKVEAGVIDDKRSKKKDRMPIVFFKGVRKPLGLNKTNSKTIAVLYGNEVESWIGKLVQLYPTKTNFGDEQNIDCIRIRPAAPTGQAGTVATPPAPPPAEDEDEELEADSGDSNGASAEPF